MQRLGQPGQLLVPCQLRRHPGRPADALAFDPGAESFITFAYPSPHVGTASEASTDHKLLGANLALGCSDSGADVGLDDVIFQEAFKLGVPVANPYAAFKQAGQSFISGDGLHPNDAGHAAIAQSFREASVSCPASPPSPDPGDTTLPETTITKKPKDKEKATFEFTSNEPGSTFECSLNGSDFAPCSSPFDVKAKKGNNSFLVRAKDAAGNVDSSAASDGWKFKKKKKKKKK